MCIRRLTLKAINDEFRRRGHDVQLEKGDGYFIFQGGEAANWLDTTVRVPTVSSLTLEQWLDGSTNSRSWRQSTKRSFGAAVPQKILHSND